ncbi:MAG: AhpC/TSA family protein, partial [Bacteroides sp.]
MLLTLCLWVGICLAQQSFVVEGEVDDYRQGMMVRLFRMEGDVGSSIAWDTIQDGRFRLEVPVDSGKVVELDLLTTEGT